MSGHGHVIPNPDGSRFRCGGPGICAECSREAAREYVKLRAELVQARAERDALRATVANLVTVLTDARAALCPPSVRFEAGYPLPAHLRITSERAQLLGRIDAAIDAARAKETKA